MIKAKLVYSGSDVRIPEDMGIPRDDQMQGTAAEQLGELAGRVCYDSLGKGRSSKDYHSHILEVGHLSVYEHFNFTFQCEMKFVTHFLNRPGFYIGWNSDGLMVTTNLRGCLDYSRFSPYSPQANLILLNIAHHFAQQIQPLEADPELPDWWWYRGVPDDNQRWISVWLQCSRGCSHELVRHGDFTAISQRSTRYVDESESDWIPHPLMNAWTSFEENTIYDCQQHYRTAVELLEAKLINQGVPKLTARKQARGAARGILGNALSTQMIFSANVNQWRHMFRMRMSEHADAEIRILFNRIYEEFSQDASISQHFTFGTKPSPDGLGYVLSENN